MNACAWQNTPQCRHTQVNVQKQSFARKKSYHNITKIDFYIDKNLEQNWTKIAIKTILRSICIWKFISKIHTSIEDYALLIQFHLSLPRETTDNISFKSHAFIIPSRFFLHLSLFSLWLVISNGCLLQHNSTLELFHISNLSSKIFSPKFKREAYCCSLSWQFQLSFIFLVQRVIVIISLSHNNSYRLMRYHWIKII